MLRPLLAFACLAATAFLLAPTVHSVHEQVEELDIKRDLPHLWKWDQPDPPLLLPPICDDSHKALFSEVDQWPERIRKNETFTLGGFVREGDAKGAGVAGVVVDLFLNETKTLPGDQLGTAVTGADGRFTLTTSVPFELQATKYHLVAHALSKRVGCTNYTEHWSDPEMEVTSRTRIVLYPVEEAVAGHPFFLRGVVLDSVGAPVRHANLTLTLDGDDHRVTTNGEGQFVLEHKVPTPRNLTWRASFAGTKYYGASKAESYVDVANDALRLDLPSIELVRSRPTAFSGRLILPPGEKVSPLNVSFEGVNLSSCAGCAPSSRVVIQPEPDGSFRVDLLAASDQRPGVFRAVVRGGGLSEPHALEGRILVPVNLTLTTENGGLFGKSLGGKVVVTDEVGRPWSGAVAVETPAGRLGGPLDGEGAYVFRADSPCGTQRVRALYDGDGQSMPATSEQDVPVCPLLAFVPGWLLAIPWWVWPLALLAGLAAWYAFRRWRDATAATITRGPPLTLSHTRPADAAAGIVEVGETVAVTAFLEDPLPDGHTLRMGPARHTEPALLGPDLRAECAFTPDRLGEHVVRAEILDARGRVVTRRSLPVRAVLYAEEIETRYRRLRGESGASESVTPREFEAWLRERAPDLDPEIAARLVGVFEEADYGPRRARRAELVAYMEAETALPEVKPRAPLA